MNVRCSPSHIRKSDSRFTFNYVYMKRYLYTLIHLYFYTFILKRGNFEVKSPDFRHSWPSMKSSMKLVQHLAFIPHVPMDGSI